MSRMSVGPCVLWFGGWSRIQCSGSMIQTGRRCPSCARQGGSGSPRDRVISPMANRELRDTSPTEYEALNFFSGLPGNDQHGPEDGLLRTVSCPQNTTLPLY